MSRLSIKLGYWSAVLSAIVTIGYGIGVGILVIFFPMPSWTNLSDFMAAVQPASLVAFTLAQVMLFLLAPLSVILFCSFHDYAPDDKKVLTRVGLCAMIATMVLGNQMYFVHFNSMRMVFSEGLYTGLERLVEWNTNSAIMASGTLGWTFFAGLGYIFVAPIFSGGGLARWLKYACLVYGSCTILETVGFLLENMVFGFVYFMGGMVAGVTTMVLASILFKRLENEATLRVPPPKPGLP